MSNRGHVAVPNSDTLDDEWEPRENLEWVDTHIKRQNQCFWLTVVLLIVVGASYTIGGMSLGNSDALEGEKYSAESGILADGFAGDKEQDLFEEELDGNKNGKDWWKGQDKENPFGNQNAKEHGNEVLWQKRWNATHPNQPFQPGFPHGHSGVPGQTGTPGKQGGMNGFTPGNRPTKPHNEAPPANNHLRPGQSTTGPTATPQAKSLDGQLPADVCDHSTYADWLAATVTLADGIKYEVVQRLVHDTNAFL